MPSLSSEVQDLTAGSIAFAKTIDHATAGSRLTPVMTRAMDADMRPFNRLRNEVQEHLRRLGGVGQELGLFMLAADMATTAEVVQNLSREDKAELRRLWNDLRSR